MNGIVSSIGRRMTRYSKDIFSSQYPNGHSNWYESSQSEEMMKHSTGSASQPRLPLGNRWRYYCLSTFARAVSRRHALFQKRISEHDLCVLVCQKCIHTAIRFIWRHSYSRFSTASCFGAASHPSAQRSQRNSALRPRDPLRHSASPLFRQDGPYRLPRERCMDR
jgi:hypothetical protein